MKKRRIIFVLLVLILLVYAFWRRKDGELKFFSATTPANFNDVPPTVAAVEEKFVVTTAAPVPEALDIFIIMTNFKKRSNLAPNFERFYTSLREFSSKNTILHALCDEESKKFLTRFHNLTASEDSKIAIQIVFHDAHEASEKIKDVISAMKPFFSSASGSYYSDDLFFLSLGLHLISPLEKAVLVDLDTEFRADPAVLFQFFSLFTEEQLFGLGPELSPVYKHILFKYLHKLEKNPKNIGEPDIEEGYSGYNSGVVLLDLEKMRLSAEYESLIVADAVRKLAEQYQFKGHLGDQDYFTLLGLQHAHLIFKLPCSWNRQMCQWWREHGYADIFDRYFACEGKVRLYHGNCNSKIPER